MLKSPISKVDEFAFFNEAITLMVQMRPQDIQLIFSTLKENEKKTLKEMLLTKTSERQGRVIDHDSSGSMEKKKMEGYF